MNRFLSFLEISVHGPIPDLQLYPETFICYSVVFFLLKKCLILKFNNLNNLLSKQLL